MQPVRALQSTGKSKACFTWHYAFVKNSLIFSVILFTAIMRLEQEMTLVYIGMTALNTLKVQ